MRRKSGAVDHATGAGTMRRRHQPLHYRTNPKTDRDSQVIKSVCQRGKRGSRVQVALLAEVQRLVETPPKIRFQRSDRFTIEPFKPLGAPAELHQICGIASMSHHQATVEGRAGKSTLPPCETLPAEFCNERLGSLQLTPRRQHAAGVPGAARCAKGLAAVEHFDRGATLGKLEGARKPRDASADD